MAAKASLLFTVAFFLLALSTTSTAFNITKVLGQYPDYGTFNDLLSQTKLAQEINRRQTITTLALDNNSISSIKSRPMDEVKKILMNHVILDYFDTLKIQKLGKKSAILTTLYQTTGVATEQQGFVNITRIAPGDVVFGSGVKGAPLVSKLLGSVVAQPFNLSVLHVSTPIVAPGFGDPVLAPPPPPGSKPPAPAPKKAEAPAPSKDVDSDYEGEAPDSAPSPASSDAPADAPAADSPTKSPPSPKDADEEEADAPASASCRVGSSMAVAAMMGLVASLIAF